MSKFEIMSFTGHRPNKFGTYDESSPIIIAIKAELEKAIRYCITECGTALFIAGGALGVDTWAAEIVLKLRDDEKLPVKLLLAVPCKSQELRWPKPSQARYNNMLKRADGVKMVFEGTYEQNPKCMHDRDEWMVNSSQGLIAVWDGSPGGTGHTAEYAKKVGKPIYRIIPGNVCKITPFTTVGAGKVTMCRVGTKLPDVSIKLQMTISKKVPSGWTRVEKLAPSTGLFRWYVENRDKSDWFETYKERFLKELDMDYFERFAARVREATNEGKNVALSCFCVDWTKCHRSIVGKMLEDRSIQVVYS